MSIVSLTVTLDAGERHLVLDLDPAMANERTILAHLESGAFYEPDVAKSMIRILRPGDTVVDVGANVGFFTVFAAMLAGATGAVVSFEPDPNNLWRLRRNIALNNLANVTVIESPVTDRPGEVQFFHNSDDSGGSALWDPGVLPANVRSLASPQPFHLTATTLDQALAERGVATPRLIKIDTEGAEHRVLAGTEQLLRDQRVPFIIAELHPFGLDRMGSSAEALRGFMAERGYDTFCLYYDGSLPKLIPPGTTLRLPFILNLLFSTQADVARVWPVETFNPHATVPANG